MKRLLATLVLGALLLSGCGGSAPTLAPNAAPVATSEAPPPASSGSPAPVKPASPAAPAESRPAEAAKPAAEQKPDAPAATPANQPAPVSPKPRAPRVAILMYHDINEQEDEFTISPALFEAQIRMLLEEGYHFYSLRDMERLLAGEPMPEKGVMLTFDDGYTSFYRDVVPIAQKYGVPAVCFVITMYLDQTIIGGRPHMTSAETQAAAASPFGELGGHSYNAHYVAQVADGSFKPALTNRILRPGIFEFETPELYAERVLDDYQRTARLLAAHGETTGLRHFAFPFTVRSEDAVKLGQQAGFQYFYIGGEQLAHAGSDPTAIPRIHAGGPEFTPEFLRDRLRRHFAR